MVKTITVKIKIKSLSIFFIEYDFYISPLLYKFKYMILFSSILFIISTV